MKFLGAFIAIAVCGAIGYFARKKAKKLESEMDADDFTVRQYKASLAVAIIATVVIGLVFFGVFLPEFIESPDKEKFFGLLLFLPALLFGPAGIVVWYRWKIIVTGDQITFPGSFWRGETHPIGYITAVKMGHIKTNSGAVLMIAFHGEKRLFSLTDVCPGFNVLAARLKSEGVPVVGLKDNLPYQNGDSTRKFGRKGKAAVAAAVAAFFTLYYFADDGEGGGSDIVGGDNCASAAACKSAVMPDGKTWMTENLNILTAKGSWCYENSPDSCEKYGRLYTWWAAKRACPSGWHLPSSREWGALVNAAGGDGAAGKALKSASGWRGSGGNGTDKYGFSALPGGQTIDSRFLGDGIYGFWWTATNMGASNGSLGSAYTLDMSFVNDRAREGNSSKRNALSVRCVAD
ncbi:hypothetical protein R80B4_02115 [Fibrobacteres bacterium R8-0-B4]